MDDTEARDTFNKLVELVVDIIPDEEWKESHHKEIGSSIFH